MPLLLKKPFRLEPVPDNLKPDEEVFVCPATKEVFRDYESFFNRHFLCESLVWTCEFSGQSNLTYSQAVQSEKEARKQLDSLPPSYQKAALNLVHHTRRTNIKTLAEEIISFYRHRFIEGEVVDLVQMKTVGVKILTPVRVVKVIPPSPPPTSPLKSPSKPSLDTASTPISTSLPQSKDNSSVSQSPKAVSITEIDLKDEHVVSNGLNVSDETTPAKHVFKSPKTPRTPSTPLSSEVSFKPEDYRYVVREVGNPEKMREVKSGELCRPKGTFTTNKLKILFRTALGRKSEKHPFIVKEEFVSRYDLGLTTVDYSLLPSPSPSSRKRSLSQSQISSYFSLNSSISSSNSASSLSETKPKKPKTLSLDISNKRKKPSKKRSTSGGGKKTPSGKGSKSKKSKTPSKTRKSPFHKMSDSTGKKSPSKRSKLIPSTPKSPKTPRSTMEALKVLNKAKKFKQLDLKSSLVHRDSQTPLSAEEFSELKKKYEEESRFLQRELEKQRRKEDRLRKLREAHEQKRLEKMKQKEWLKPREDTLCEDSKELPPPKPIETTLPPELFGEAVMVLEFLQSFGPLFNIKEVIRGDISVDKIEYAVTTHEIDSLLFDLIKFLLQAIFATMEDEHEGQIDVKSASSRKRSTGSPHEDPLSISTQERNETASSEPREAEIGDNQPREETHEAIDDDEMEGEKNEAKSLDVRVESIKASATLSAIWSFSTQRVPLKEMILDQYTCTEVLRLHLLSSGGYTDTEGRNWFRHCRRGGYSDSDDPAIGLRLRRPDVVEALGRSSIYALPPKDKLEILSTLCTQLLTYVDAREFIEETSARVKNARRQIREILFSEERRKREEKSAQYKEKMEKARLKKQHKKEKAEGATSQIASGATEVEVKITDDSDATKPDVVAIPTDKAKTSPTEEKRKSPRGSPVTTDSNKRGHKEELDNKPVEKELSEEEHRARIDDQLFELNQELLEASACVNLRPLGMDRNYSKYWIFPNLPGLYIEHTKKTTTSLSPSSTQDKESIPNEAHRPSLPSTIITETTANPLVGVSNGNDELSSSNNDLQSNEATHSTSRSEHAQEFNGISNKDTTESNQSDCSTWSCYATLEEIDNLLTALNPRGLREVELKKAIETQRRHFESSLSKGPFHPDYVSPSSNKALINNADEYLELYLREQILDIEDKIVMGNLGYMKDVDNRVEWRDAIENSGAAAALLLSQATQSTSNALDVSGNDKPLVVASGCTTPLINSSAHELSAALLQVYNGIEKKFLMPPLGTAVDHKKRQTRKTKKEGGVKEGDLCPVAWKESLAKATSFSQIFVHLATLERTVMWSKSLMNVRCRICRRKCGDEFLLLCDGCDHGYHTYCLRPPLKQIPEGNWFCSDCNPVTPIKQKRNVKKVVIIEEESSESEDEEENESDEDSEGIVEEESSEESEEEEEEVTQRVTRSRIQHEPATRGRKRKGRGGATNQARKQAKVVKSARGKLQTGKEKGRSAKKTGDSSHQAGTKARRQSDPSTPEVTRGTENGRARKKLKLEGVTSPKPSKAETMVASIIDLRCSRSSKQHTGASRREQKGLEMQLCEALWEEMRQEKESWYFDAPVTKREYPDYFDVISAPMDLHTVKQKIKTGRYDSLGEFVKDIRLIFSNCVKYHKRHSLIGKAGVSLKALFEKRCGDLGLSDLGLMRSEHEVVNAGNKTGRRTSSRQRK